jgi:DNA-binding MarR family transcriptional regulator
MHPHHAPGELDTDVDLSPPPVHLKAAFSLLRVSALLSEELDRELEKATGLGLSEILVILQIMFSGGRLKMADLADTLVVTRGGVTKIVDRLVSGGYLDRVHSVEDRRVVYAHVTDAATDLIRTHQPMVEAITARRFAVLLDETEVDQLHELMHRLSCENPGWAPPDSVVQSHGHDEEPAA